jgi:glycosyltransferase involved in cell wall biosynthesis
VADDNQPGRDHGSNRPTALFVMEQTLGHITHTKNLQALMPRDGALLPEFILVPYETGRWTPPGWSNWTIRAGVRAASRLVRRRRHGPRPAAMFVHTQVPAVLLGAWMRTTPTVVSIDATPKQYDELGEFYAHHRSHPRVEDLKYRANLACFRKARHLVSWSHWGKKGLVEGYGVDPGMITVIAPGVDVDRWQPSAIEASEPGDPVRVLFVGGDLQRKGGSLLVEAVCALRDEPGLPPIELHLVTGSTVRREPGVVVHRGLTSNSTELIEQYHAADVFCLPTFGDCLPMVLAEAAAAGLPMISTNVGAIGEIVRSGETGELIPPHDLGALISALRKLIADPSLRVRYGEAARRLAEAEHDARANAGRIAALLEHVSEKSVMNG